VIEPRRVRVFLVALAFIGIPLGVLALAGATIALRQLERQRDAQVAQMAGVVAALVGEAEDALRREAFVLARDPALVESAVKGDWAVLARWGAPRILALTRTGAVDLLVVRDARGTPLVQVPPLVRGSPVASPAPVDPRVSLTVIDDRPYVLATAALSTSSMADAAGSSPGTVVIGRRVETLGRALEKLPGRPGLVFVAGDRALGATRAESPSGGWAAAVGNGRAVLGGEAFALRPLPSPESVSSPGALWALVPEAETGAPVRRIRSWLIALSVGGAVILALGVGIVVGAFNGRGQGGFAGAAAAPDAGGPGP
jgi:hypothetical protein